MSKSMHHSKIFFQGYQDAFPVVPFGCSENQATLEEFISKAKAALVSVGIIRDPVMGKLFYKLFCIVAKLEV